MLCCSYIMCSANSPNTTEPSAPGGGGNPGGSETYPLPQLYQQSLPFGFLLRNSHFATPLELTDSFRRFSDGRGLMFMGPPSTGGGG